MGGGILAKDCFGDDVGGGKVYRVFGVELFWYVSCCVFLKMKKLGYGKKITLKGRALSHELCARTLVLGYNESTEKSLPNVLVAFPLLLPLNDLVLLCVCVTQLSFKYPTSPPLSHPHPPIAQCRRNGLTPCNKTHQPTPQLTVEVAGSNRAGVVDSNRCSVSE